MTMSLKDNPEQLFPPDLFEMEKPDPEHPWWVARTKTRQEKALAKALRGKKISYFLPLVSRPQKSKGRMRTSIVPLFSGYLFFQGDLSKRQAALQTSRIAQVISVEGQRELHNQLQAIARLCEQQADLKLVDFVKPGTRVKIIAGPLEGLMGTVQKSQSKTRLIIKVDAIGQAVGVEIGLDQIQPL